MTATPSTSQLSGPTPADHATALRPGHVALLAAGSALVGLLLVAMVTSAVAGLLAAPGTRAFPGADKPAPDPSPWLLAGLAAPARAAVKIDLAQAVPAVQPVLRGLAGSVSVDAATGDCHGGAASCSYAGQGLDGRWGIHLDARTTSATYPSNRFLVYHEIGHAVWGLLMDDGDRQAFAHAVRTALHGEPCVDGDNRPCAVLGEVFADEFARYAGGFAVSMSYYETPSLLDVPTFAELARHWASAPAAPPGRLAPLTGVLWWRRA